jgi:uncharacterized membrane protein
MAMQASLRAWQVNQRAALKAYTCAIAFASVASVATALLALNPGPAPAITAALIVALGAAVVAAEVRWKAFLSVIALGAAVEIVGMYTGLPFGAYAYTGAWWPSLPLPGGHQFPLVLPLAWAMIAGSCFLVARAFLPQTAAIVAGAALATVVDLPMEVAMVEVFGYWRWADGGPLFGVPVMNSVGWFATSLVAGAILSRGHTGGRTRAGWVAGLFAIFVSVAGAITLPSLAWPLLAAVGLTVCALQWRSPSNA